jgi:hypothetical protein
MCGNNPSDRPLPELRRWIEGRIAAIEHDPFGDMAYIVPYKKVLDQIAEMERRKG